jgi:hypothetical protein
MIGPPLLVSQVHRAAKVDFLPIEAAIFAIRKWRRKWDQPTVFSHIFARALRGPLR